MSTVERVVLVVAGAYLLARLAWAVYVVVAVARDFRKGGR